MKTNISLPERFGVFSMILASIYLIYESIFPIIFNLTGDFDKSDFIANLIILTIGIGVLYGAIVFVRRTMLYTQSIDLIFEDIYPKIEPVLREAASIQVDLEMMSGRLDAMNTNIEHLKKQVQTPAGSGGTGAGTGTGVAVGTSVTTFLHLVMLVNITLGVFIFLLQYPRWYVPYVLTLLYVIWWIAVTAEYDLWKISKSWTWVLAPILIVPTISIVTDILAGSYMLLAWMAIGLVVYTSVYYLWGRYLVHGILPYDLHRRLKLDHTKLRGLYRYRERPESQKPSESPKSPKSHGSHTSHETTESGNGR
ncbi:MAG: hypothetical protein KAT13_02310 [Methanosarcinales archaeon]|nr:hypothetical protein [Methanosarcinales archaeon]MCK4651904.1 hypothetical protein [Methanosarcinales archaeon]